MILIRQAKIFGFFLGLLYSGTLVFANTGVNTRLYPLPMVELEEILSGWLGGSGFGVRRTSYEMGQVNLNAEKNEEVWQISLRHHSPLATVVQVNHTVQGRVEPLAAQKLWNHISKYMNARPIEITNSDQVIPATVLSHIESVVCIKAKVGERVYQTSGFVVDEAGLIVCTAHDLKGRQITTVVLYNGCEIEGKVLKIDPHRDLALIRVNSRLNTHISLARGRNLLGKGEKVYSVGCPNSLAGTVTAGAVTVPPRKANDLPLWQVDMNVYPGSSGSPVFDAQGNLVAIVKGRFRGTLSVGFLIPLETLLDFLQET